MPNPAIFISYRRIDANWAAVMLRHQIQRNFPDVDVFIDVASIRPGQHFKSAIQDNIKDCAILFAVIGPNWLTTSDNYGMRRIDKKSDLVRNEIAQALAQDHTCVVPFLVDDAPMPPAEALPEALRGLHELDAFRMKHSVFERDMEDVCRFIEEHLGIARSVSPPEPARIVEKGGRKAAPDEIADAVVAALIDAGTDWKTVQAVARMRDQEGKPALAYQIGTLAQTLIDGGPGWDSPDSLNNQLYLLRYQLKSGNTQEAEIASRSLIEMCEEILGKDHSSTLAARHNHSFALLNLGRVTEAEAAQRKLVPLCEMALGAEHPDTLSTRQEHARALLSLGRLDEAEAALRDLVPRRETVQGAEHPDTLATRHAHARALLEAENSEAADRVLQAAKTTEDMPAFRRGQRAMLDAMLADQGGDAPAADAALDVAAEFLSDLEPEHYLRRELDHYRKTRIPGKPGGTTLWARP